MEEKEKLGKIRHSLSHLMSMAVQELSRIFSVCRQTATKWLDSWEQQGLNALSDKPRSGRPPKDSKAKKDKSI